MWSVIYFQSERHLRWFELIEIIFYCIISARCVTFNFTPEWSHLLIPLLPNREGPMLVPVLNYGHAHDYNTSRNYFELFCVSIVWWNRLIILYFHFFINLTRDSHDSSWYEILSKLLLYWNMFSCSLTVLPLICDKRSHHPNTFNILT